MPQDHLDDDVIDLRDLLDQLWAGKAWIAGAFALSVLTGLLYVMGATPVYEADALIRVEREGSMVPGLELFDSGVSGSPATQAQIQILRSRSVLGATVDQLNLTTRATPRQAPLLYRLFGDPAANPPAAARFGLSRYDWGGAHIRVSRMDVPRHWLGEPFTLVAGENGRWSLHGPDGREVLTGRVEEPASATLNGGEIGLFIPELDARPGTEFVLVRDSRSRAVRALRDRLQAREEGRDTGIIELRLQGHDPAETAQILSVIAQTYLRQNTERRSAEARESLRFIESQLPELRAGVEYAERRLAGYQQDQDTVDLTVETEKLLAQLVEIDRRISGLETERASLRRRYAEQHPLIGGIDAQIDSLRLERAEIEGRVQGLPDKQREMLSLQRELRVATEVYTQMLNTAQELRVAEAGTVGNVRIVDDAEAGPGPVAPRRTLTLALSGMLGLMLGAGIVFGRRMMVRGVESPELLAQSTGLSVYAVIPHSEALARERRRHERGRRPDMPILSREMPIEPASEALRSLRTALHFGLRDPGRRVVAVTSPGPGAGKSTLCINLGLLLAETNQSVVVVDGDLRLGHLAAYINGAEASTAGLADVLAGVQPLDACLKNLDEAGRAVLLPKGTTPPNPAELLFTPRLGELVSALRDRYDWVILDAPPIMAVTDAAILAQEASATFVVVRAAQDEVAAVNDSVRRLQQSGVTASGLILNDFGARRDGAAYAAYHYHYHYDYSAKQASR